MSLPQRRRRIRHRPDDPRELAALQQLAALAAAPSDVVLRGADRLLRAATGLYCHQVAVSDRGNEPQHAIASIELDQDHAAPRAGEEIDFVSLAEERPGLARRSDDRLAAGDLAHPNHLGVLRRARIPSSGARARFGERLEAEAQTVAVAR